MKIVFLVDSLHSIAAGSERQIYKLTDGLVQHGHDVELILLRDTAFTRSNFSFPCRYRTLGIKSLASFSTVKILWQLRRLLIANGVDVVHAWFPDSCLVAPLFLKHRKLRVITSRRDMGLIYQGKPAWLFSLMRWRTDSVISNSAAVSALVSEKEKLNEQKSRIIYNGIDTFSASETEHLPLFKNSASIKLILVANIKPVKRTLDAVKAVHALLLGGQLVELALVGEPQNTEYVTRIQAFIAEKGIGDAIHFCGSLNEPRRVLPQADMGLLVSDSEGLSNTIMEYMQAGLPVIATRVGGNPELVIDALSGVLIEKGDINALADAIMTLGHDESLRTFYGDCAKARIAQEFSLAAMIIQHEKIYGDATS